MTAQLTDSSLNRNHSRSHRYLQITALLCAGLWAYLASVSRAYGDASLTDLLLVSGAVGVLSLGLVYYYWHHHYPLPLIPILLWACVFRFIGLFGYPVLEDDHYRFLWDAYQTVTAGSPYIAAPIYFFDAELPARFEDILGAINYPDVPTIYAPVTQWVFAAAYLLAPGEVWAIKLLLLVFDIGLLVVLAYLIHVFAKRNPNHPLLAYQPIALLLYAWSPLLIKETALTAHPDIIGVFFIISAWALQYISHNRTPYLAILCALAVGSKIFALVMVPFILQLSWRRWLVFLVTLALIFLPYLKDLWNLAQSVQTMGNHWIFNAPIYLALGHALQALGAPFEVYLSVMGGIKALGLLVFVVLWLAYFTYFYRLPAYLGLAWRYQKALLIRGWLKPSRGGLPRGDWVFGAFFLVIPAFNPWYLVWLLPFAVIYPSIWAWVASFSLLLAYVIGLNLPDSALAPYNQPLWAVGIEYLLIALGVWLSQRRGLL